MNCYFTEIGTQYCVDKNFAFSESLAKAYCRILESKNQTVFLHGNAFLAKLARAIFEQNANLFAKTCEKYFHSDKAESYFKSCVKTLKKYGFVIECGKEINRDSWRSLYEAVRLLIEECLSTKCTLPKVKVYEAKKNNDSLKKLKIIIASQNATEKDLEKAVLKKLKDRNFNDSSDEIKFGNLFYDFLNKRFPCKNSKEKFIKFIEEIYDKKVCKNLDWLYKKAVDKTLPCPQFIAGVMSANQMGAYKDGVVYINQRLILDAIRNQESGFVLMITLLHEYGHFLDDVLWKKAKLKGGDTDGEEGELFASNFIEYSSAYLLNKNFEFADFNVPDIKNKKQNFKIGISDLSYKHRKGIISIFDFGDSLGNGDLELTKPNNKGETVIKDVEFFGLDWLPGVGTKAYNAVRKTHQELTKAGAKNISTIKINEELTDGSIWPDFPSKDPFKLNISSSLAVLSEISIIKGVFSFFNKKDCEIEEASHFGENQHWHSMCPKLKNNVTMKNIEVQEKILEELKKWYENALNLKKNGDLKKSLFMIGKLCHTIQDSFVLSHCFRRYVGDEEFINESKIIPENDGKIWSFQNYEEQNSNYHALADAPTQEINIKSSSSIKTIGYANAEKATTEIMLRYSENFKWDERKSGISSPKEYLQKIYTIYPGREKEISGKCHPWFVKDNKLSKNKICELLSDFSLKMS